MTEMPNLHAIAQDRSFVNNGRGMYVGWCWHGFLIAIACFSLGDWFFAGLLVGGLGVDGAAAYAVVGKAKGFHIASFVKVAAVEDGG